LNQAEITGLCANVLCGSYSCPVIIVHKTNEDGVLQGSVRSEGVAKFRDMVRKTGLVIFANGHDSAFGIQVKEENWDKLISTLNKKLAKVEFVKTSSADVILKPEQITTDLIKKMEYINMISGTGFKPITVVMEGVEVEDLSRMLNKHTKFEVKGIDCLAWNSPMLFQDLLCIEGIYKKIDILGTLSLGKFRGKQSMQIIIQDTRNIEDGLCFLR
jgi:single-stranded DNA-specific DHH superfamily exonuclease